MVKVFLFSGQSNMSAYSPMGTLQGSGLVTNPGSPGTAPYYVPSYQQTAVNEWGGAPPASVDTGVMYPYPTLANSACTYNENIRGSDGLFNARGAYVKRAVTFNSSGALVDVSQYGPEVSFLQRHLAVYPSVPLGAMKVAFGGTSLRGDWLPPTVSMGGLQAVSGTALTLSVTDPGTAGGYAGGLIRILSGAAAGQLRTITAYIAGSQAATLDSAFSPAPSAGDTYGVERASLRQLRLMYQQEAAYYTSTYGAGGWQIGGLVWMQGEAGAHADLSGGDGQYLSDSRAFYAYIRAMTGTPALPVIIGRIGDNWTKDNAYLAGLGYPYGAIDYSITGDGHVAGAQATRNVFSAGAYTRRATQMALGQDSHCAWYSNDGYPVLPYINQNNFYHFAGAGNLTQGERAFAAYRALVNPLRTRLRTPGGGHLKIRGLS